MRNLTPGNGADCTEADRAISVAASCSGARAFAHNADTHVSGRGWMADRLQRVIVF